MRTALIGLVMRVVLHHSLRRRREVLRVAMACSPSAQVLAWDRLTACCPADSFSQRPR